MTESFLLLYTDIPELQPAITCAAILANQTKQPSIF